jgi:hypothetical protein
MQLDSSRNHIILVNLWLSMINISVMATTILPAFFGTALFGVFASFLGLFGGMLFFLLPRSCWALRAVGCCPSAEARQGGRSGAGRGASPHHAPAASQTENHGPSAPAAPKNATPAPIQA